VGQNMLSGGIIGGSCFGHLFEAGKGLLFWQLRQKQRASMGGG